MISPASLVRRAEMIVCDECGIFPYELRRRYCGSLARPPRVVRARALLAQTLRYATEMSWPEIARVCGYNNHTSVLSAMKRLSEYDRDAATTFAVESMTTVMPPAACVAS